MKSCFLDTDVPLAEDWDLQGFEPLQEMLNKFKLVLFILQ